MIVHRNINKRDIPILSLNFVQHRNNYYKRHFLETKYIPCL